MRAVYLGGNNTGGTYRVFLNLRRGLGEKGIDLWLEQAIDLLTATSNREAICAAKALIDQLSGFDCVIVNAFMAPAMMNIVRYLPPRVPRILIVHNITYATLQAARALRDFVHETVCVSPRIRDDLVRVYRFDPSKTHTILNALDTEFCADPSHPRSHNAILSLGRIEDASKGILELPKIFDATIARHGTLTIAGDGPDREALHEAFCNIRVSPNWAGLVPPEKVGATYAKNSIFLFPSRFEGMGLALAEAMSSGLVPIATRIRGVTDQFIDDKLNGFLFDQGNIVEARARLGQLLANPMQVEAMRLAAAERANSLFALSTMAQAYYEIIYRLREEATSVQSLPLAHWRIPQRMRPGLRSLLPSKIRRRIADTILRIR